jgi:hypothetical protein
MESVYTESLHWRLCITFFENARECAGRERETDGDASRGAVQQGNLQVPTLIRLLLFKAIELPQCLLAAYLTTASSPGNTSSGMNNESNCIQVYLYKKRLYKYMHPPSPLVRIPKHAST